MQQYTQIPTDSSVFGRGDGEHSSMEPDPKRRKLRKECKRRKVKCEFTNPSDEVCIACRRRGGTCISQEFPEETSHAQQDTPQDGQAQLANRLLRVESLLSQLVKQVGDKSVESLLGNDAGVLTPSPTVHSDSIPAIIESVQASLENSPQLQIAEPNPFCTQISAGQDRQRGDQIDLTAAKHKRISTSLCAAFPSRQDILTLCGMKFDSSIYLHQIWYNPNIDFSPNGRDIIDTLLEPPSPEMHPVLLAKKMLMVALFLQYFPPTGNHGFKESPAAITERIADEAIKLVTTNEELHGWIESIHCILLEAQYHANLGNLRRSWLALRRAMMVAQLMGLDRQSPPRFRILDNSMKHDTPFLWHNIVYQDRYLSLILGLPAGNAEEVSEYERTVRPGLTGTSWLSLELQHSRVVKLLIDRGTSADPDANTKEIDNMLLRAAKSVPDDFWVLPNFEGPDNGQGVFWRTLRTMNQVKHYSLLNCLHLPYLMREDKQGRYEHSKVACLMASREILRRYIAFRGLKPILSCCRPLDFIALLAALTVMVAQMNVHRPGMTYSFLSHQRHSDRALIDQVLVVMDRVAQVNDDVMTYKGACLLRRLLHIEAEAHAGNCYLTQEVNKDENASTRDGPNEALGSVLDLDIPYFGTIRIARTSAQNTARPSISEATPTHGGSRTTMQQVFPPFMNGGGLIDFSLQPESEDNMGQLEQFSYPDITATVDDWAFQGVDTNFFASIMASGNMNIGSENGLMPSQWSQAYMPIGKHADDFLKPTSAFAGLD